MPPRRKTRSTRADPAAPDRPRKTEVPPTPPAAPRKRRAKAAAAPADAQSLALQQREISVSEFFAKNRHLLGFDNPSKALLTTVKEAVDNALDACEEAQILPELSVVVRPVPNVDSRFDIVIQDNGPGIVKAQAPRIFGKLLYGSKFHSLKMSRGQQGIGISAAGLYGQLTTGRPMDITTRTGPKRRATHHVLQVNTAKNEPQKLLEEEVDVDFEHGTRIQLQIEARHQKGRRSVDEYLRQVAVANPHMTLRYTAPDGTEAVWERVTSKLPPPPVAIRPHPYGVELGILLHMMQGTKSHWISGFLSSDFTRISPRVATEICKTAGISPKAHPKRVTRDQAEALHRAMNSVKVMAPPTNCITPIGEDLISASLQRETEADLVIARTRSPVVYRGNPFLLEVGVAFGGNQPADEPVRLLRYANRVPLLYQQSACAITQSVLETNWKSYGLQQPRGALPVGPMVLFVHMASVWVPFTSESKEAVAPYPEILKEAKLALQECGRKLGSHIRAGARRADAERKSSYIQKYIPHIGIALQEILALTDRQRDRIVQDLTIVLQRSRDL